MVLIRPGMFDDKMSAEWRPGHHGRCTHGTGAELGPAVVTLVLQKVPSEGL